jgi:hypothetical protein
MGERRTLQDNTTNEVLLRVIIGKAAIDENGWVDILESIDINRVEIINTI